MGHFLPGSHCALVVHSSISQLPLADQIKTRNAGDEITGEGEEEGRAHSGRDSLVVGGGGVAGHPIATIYFPSAARNTSGQEERERKRERAVAP